MHAPDFAQRSWNAASAVQSFDMRPLSVAELLDRAISVCVLHWRLLVCITAVIVVPLTIVDWIIDHRTSDGLQVELFHAQAVSKTYSAQRYALFGHLFTHLAVIFVPLVVANGMFGALATAAGMTGVAQTYAGKPCSVGTAYRAALRRSNALLCVIGLACALGIGLLIPGGVALFVLAMVVNIFYLISPVAAAIVGIPIGFACVVAIAFIVAFVYLAGQLAFFAIVVEDRPLRQALAVGWNWIGGPGLVSRSIPAVATVGAICLFGLLIVGGITAELEGLGIGSVLDAVVDAVVDAVGRIVMQTVLTAFIVVYAIDERVRREAGKRVADGNVASEPMGAIA